MGREIRRVPKSWEHPTNERCPHLNGLEWSHMRHTDPNNYQYGKCFKPLYDNDFDTALEEWIEGYEQWKRGEHPSQKDRDFWKDTPYWDYAGAPPNPEYYRPAWKPEEMTCYQIYETVSEGTPTSPVFETLEEMRIWLIQNGYSEAAANGFVKEGWVPSMVYSDKTGAVTGIEIAGLPHDEKQ